MNQGLGMAAGFRAGRWHASGMEGVFRGSEALARGELTRHALRTQHRRLLPDVYAPTRTVLTLEQRAMAAWLWSGRAGVVAGLTASALHGTQFVDGNVIELNWPNHRAPPGVRTGNDTLLAEEITMLSGLPVTTVERTAFDLARRDGEGRAVGRLDALARATEFKTADVLAVADRHPHVRWLRRVARLLDLVDPGAESPKESWLRMLLISASYPRPTTQIPVPRPDGYSMYFLDMGWESIKVAVEYDGEHHREDPDAYRKDIVRAEYLAALGWLVVRVVKGQSTAQILLRVQRAVVSRGGF